MDFSEKRPPFSEPEKNVFRDNFTLPTGHPKNNGLFEIPNGVRWDAWQTFAWHTGKAQRCAVLARRPENQKKETKVTKKWPQRPVWGSAQSDQEVLGKQSKKSLLLRFRGAQKPPRPEIPENTQKITKSPILGWAPKILENIFGNGPNTVSESTVSNTELNEFFCAHRAPKRELNELLSAYYLCAKTNSQSFSQHRPSLPQNSVSALFRNSTLRTVYRPFPIYAAFFRGFKKGVGGRRLATNSAQNTAKVLPKNCVLLLIGGHRKRVQKKGRNLWYGRDFLASTPSVRQPLFRNLWFLESSPFCKLKKLRAKGTLISEPRFSCDMRFSPRDTGKMAIFRGLASKWPFCLYRVGALISVPLV